MKRLNRNSTEIFCQLIKAMNGKEHLKIPNAPYMPLTIEIIENDIGAEAGFGKLYSLCHYYVQNGDLMQDPEMTFVVVDNRKENPTEWKQVWIIPISFCQANMGIYQESGLIEKNCFTQYKPKMQAEHIAFANTWMQNIKDQGFLNQTTNQ